MAKAFKIWNESAELSRNSREPGSKSVLSVALPKLGGRDGGGVWPKSGPPDFTVAQIPRLTVFRDNVGGTLRP